MISMTTDDVEDHFSYRYTSYLLGAQEPDKLKANSQRLHMLSVILIRCLRTAAQKVVSLVSDHARLETRATD